MRGNFRVVVTDIRPKSKGGGTEALSIVCDSVIVSAGANGQALFSVRGLTRVEIAEHAASIMARLYEFDPRALATSIELLKRGRIFAAVQAKMEGEAAQNIVPTDPKQLGKEVIDLLRVMIDKEFKG